MSDALIEQDALDEASYEDLAELMNMVKTAKANKREATKTRKAELKAELEELIVRRGPRGSKSAASSEDKPKKKKKKRNRE